MALGDNKLSVFVSLRAEKFQKGIKQVQSGFKTLNRTIGAFSTAFVGQQIFQLSKQFADAAGEMETVERSFARSFAGISSSVETELGKLADSLNRNETQLKKGAVSFNAFFSGLGFVSKEAADMSVKMQTLSLDLASFFGIADSNAQKRFLSALAGSPEVLDQFGINLKQSALQLELYRMGLKSTVQNTSEVIKTQARLNIIMQAMTDSGIIGDASRGLDTYQGQLKQFDAAWITFSESMGTVVIPAIVATLSAISKLFKAFVRFKELLKGDKLTEESALQRNGRLKEELELLKKKYTLIELIADATPKVEKKTPKRTKEAEEAVRKIPVGETLIKSQQRILTKEEITDLLALNKQIKNANELKKKMNDVGIETKNISKDILRLTDMKRVLDVKVADQLKEEKTIKDGILKGIESEIDLIENKKKLKEELNSLSQLSAIELGGMAHEQALLYDLELKRNDLTGTSLDKLAEIKKFYEILVNLSNRIKPPPTGAITGSVDILSKQVNMKTGHVMGSDVAQDNLKKMGLEIKQSTIDGILRKNSDRISSIGISGKEDLKKAGEKMKEGGLTIIDILRPITDAMADIWSEILTPPDDTISKEEQKEKTMAAFAGIIVGLGQALVSLGTGALLASKGFEEAIKGNVPAALAMIAGGSALIAIGKGQLQKVKRSAAARESATGGGANDGSNGNSMASFLKAVQGEQTFRINGADLVSVVGRQNNFTNAIGG
tara:strand:+ start:1227 stop:3404 length:2178 start_codon:yes stop_codon:yes gene_type:complete